MFNHFKIDVVQNCKAKPCFGCQESFEVGEFQVSRCRVWHLDCFKPDFPTKIRISRDVEMSAEAEKHVEKFRSWVKQWNQADWLEREELPMRYFNNYVRRGRTQQPRLMLEIFKFLGAQEVELRASQVCLQWHSVARSQELWLAFFEGEFYTGPEPRNSPDLRKDYILHAFQACWNCKRLVETPNVHYVCPYYRMPLCLNCSSLPNCKPMTEMEIRRCAGLSAGQVKALEVPFFQFGAKKCTYLNLAIEKQREIRRKRKAWVLKQMENDGLLIKETVRNLSAAQPSSAPGDTPLPILQFLDSLDSDPLVKQLKSNYTRFKQTLRPSHKQTIS
jgi:hypothetical protein